MYVALHLQMYKSIDEVKLSEISKVNTCSPAKDSSMVMFYFDVYYYGKGSPWMLWTHTLVRCTIYRSIHRISCMHTCHIRRNVLLGSRLLKQLHEILIQCMMKVFIFT